MTVHPPRRRAGPSGSAPRRRPVVRALALVLILEACGGGGAPDWTAETGSGFEGSPTLCDLEGDGRPEIVVPIASLDRGDLLVLDAKTGKERLSVRNHAGFAAPFCVDADGDGVRDLVTAGRVGTVQAISGADGVCLWSMRERYPDLVIGNTYSTVALGVDPEVLFVTNGGGAPDGETFVGRVIAYRPDGEVVASFEAPDGAEVYSSPAVAQGAPGEILVAFGSGGETAPGNLFLLSYDVASATFAERWRAPSACDTGGFVASPVIVDAGGARVVVDTDYCGTVHAVDAADGTVLWTHAVPGLFGIANPLPADVDGDGRLEVVTAFESFNDSRAAETGADPRSTVTALELDSGALLWERAIPNWVYASPVAADYDGDGAEDVWVLPTDSENGTLTVFSGRDGAVLFEDPDLGATAGSPILDDVDGDGGLDLFTGRVVRTEGIGLFHRRAFDIPFDGGRAYSGFRGHPLHAGFRADP